MADVQERSKEEEAAEIESKPENEAGSRNEDEAKAEENGRESSRNEMMKPWEQHANVISIPRFDYNAPSALLLRSHSGFLITCSIKREKSATKEAMSILEKYLGSHNCGSSENTNAKRRKRTEGEIDGTFAKGVEGNTIRDADTTAETVFGLSLVKLTRSGLLLFTLLGENSLDSVDIVSKIFQCLELGSLKSPL
uniref:Uncharacterized protein LOC105123696 isoform X1 n=1 Tax=Rhizophora mucronata TaxID=61149 RepID=A0A2P2KF42_RHIMU